MPWTCLCTAAAAFALSQPSPVSAAVARTDHVYTMRTILPAFSFTPWFEFESNNASESAIMGDYGGTYPSGFYPEFYRKLAETMTELNYVPENFTRVEIEIVTAREGWICRLYWESCYSNNMMWMNAQLVDRKYFNEYNEHWAGIGWTTADGTQGSGPVDINDAMVDTYWDETNQVWAGIGDDLIFTQPMVEDYFSGFVYQERTPTSIWQVWAPFSAELWAVIGLCTCFGGVVIVLLAKISSDEDITVRSFLKAWYHSWAAVLGGDEYDLYHESPLGRLYRLGLLALVLVVGATYTANLAAFLTAPNIVVHGPKNLRELQDATACYPWKQFEWGADQMPNFVKDVVTLPEDIPVLDDEKVLEWMTGNLESGKCDVVIDSIILILKWVGLSCENFAHVPEIQFGPTPQWGLMRGDTKFERELARNVSKATRVLRAGTDYSDIMRNTLGIGKQVCPVATTSDTAQIEVRDMAGILLVYAVLGLVSLAAAGYWRWGTRAGAQELRDVRSRKAYVPAESAVVCGGGVRADITTADAGTAASTDELVRQLWISQSEIMREMGMDAKAVMMGGECGDAAALGKVSVPAGNKFEGGGEGWQRKRKEGARRAAGTAPDGDALGSAF
jgi:hypothetical protein